MTIETPRVLVTVRNWVFFRVLRSVVVLAIEDGEARIGTTVTVDIITTVDLDVTPNKVSQVVLRVGELKRSLEL